MNVLIIDTSIWIEFFKGKTYPDLELALQEARVILSPVVASELISGTRNKKEQEELIQFLQELKNHETGLPHWFRVGKLRNVLSNKGLNISIPDAHIAQCALELDGYLMSHDKIFEKIARHSSLKLLP